MGINILGSTVTGFVVYLAVNSSWNLQQLHSFALHTEPIVVTGFFGGFTTFSSALAIPYLDWRRGERRRAALLIGTTPLLCIAGFLIGEALTKF
jgi:fluoride ion exporter CrcB/FEX